MAKKDDKITTLNIHGHDRPTRDEAEKAIQTLLKWVGEDSTREGLLDTPKRVIKAFDEYTQGYAQDPAQILSKTFENEGEYHGPVIVTDIAVESHCEHHLAPFVGVAHIAYIPNNRIVGLSKLARLVDCFSKRLQVQERLTSQIANALEEHLDTKGVAVMIEAEHYCMKMRGVKKDHTKTITYVFLGEYKDDKMQERFLQKVSSRSRD